MKMIVQGSIAVAMISMLFGGANGIQLSAEVQVADDIKGSVLNVFKGCEDNEHRLEDGYCCPDARYKHNTKASCCPQHSLSYYDF